MEMFEVPVDVLLARVAEELKKDIVMPDWAKFVKTGAHKQRPPVNVNWWYLRSASILRKVALRGPIGTNKLRAMYGGSKNRGTEPNIKVVASGKITREILKQLEKAGYLVQEKKSLRKGRIITPKGVKLLESVASKIGSLAPKPIARTAEPEEEAVEVKKEVKKRAPRKSKKAVEEAAVAVEGENGGQ